MNWLDFVRKDTLLTGGMVNGVHGEVTHRFGNGPRWAPNPACAGADLNQGTQTINFQDGGGVFRYRTGDEHHLRGGGGVAHLVDRDTRSRGPARTREST